MIEKIRTKMNGVSTRKLIAGLILFILGVILTTSVGLVAFAVS